MKRRQPQEQPLLYAPPPERPEPRKREQEDHEEEPTRGVSQIDFFITPTDD